MSQTLPDPFGTGIETLPDPGVAAVIAGGGVGIESIQRTSKVLPFSTASDSVALSSSVDITKSLLIQRGVEVESDEPQLESYMITSRINSLGTEIQVDRFNVGVVVEAFYTVIEFSSGVSTQKLQIGIAPGGTSGTDSINSVDTDKTIIIPIGVKVHGSFTAGDPDIGRIWMPWWVLTSSTLVTAFRHTSGLRLSLDATALEFT